MRNIYFNINIHKPTLKHNNLRLKYYTLCIGSSSTLEHSDNANKSESKVCERLKQQKKFPEQEERQNKSNKGQMNVNKFGYIPAPY